VNLEAPSGTDASLCTNVNGPTVPNVYFRIGQISRPGGFYNRKDYDKNQYYFRFGRSTAANYQCGLTPKKMFTSFESSNSNLENNQVWALDATKSGEQFNISGKITSSEASYNNYFNFLTANSNNCPEHFQIYALSAKNKVTMTGSVDASIARISWEFTDTQTNWKVSGNFTGSWWDKGAKLDTSGTQPQTTGEAKRVGRQYSAQSWWAKHGKVIIGVVVAVGVLVSLSQMIRSNP
jgi:hypothetical protein